MTSIARIGDCVAPVATWRPERAGDGGRFEYVDLSAVDQVTKSIVAAREVENAQAPSRARQLIEANDVLVSTVRPNLNGVAKVPPGLSGATASTGFCVLRPIPGVLDADYLFHWVRSGSFISSMVRMATGASYPAVSDRIILDSPIPLPPIDDQRRIGSLLALADGLRIKRRAALAQASGLAQAVFLDMFGDRAASLARWPTGNLGQVASFVGGGTPSRARQEYFEGTVCWATSKDIRAPYLDDTQEHITEEAISSSATKLVPAGTILVVVKSKVLLHSLPVAIARVPTCFGQDLKGLVVDANHRVPYVATALRVGKDWLLSRARGINTEGLTLDHLRSFPLVLPPADVQDEFGARVLAGERVSETLGQSMDQLDALYASFQHRAFTGHL